MCSPRSGGAVGSLSVSLCRRIGEFTRSISPAVGWGTLVVAGLPASTTACRASGTERIFPAGTPAWSSAVSHSSAVLVASRSFSSGISVCAVLDAFGVGGEALVRRRAPARRSPRRARGRARRSARPRPSGPSRRRRSGRGRCWGGRCRGARGSGPVTSAFWATLTRPASALSISDTSIRAPSPAVQRGEDRRRRRAGPVEHVHQRHADLERRRRPGAPVIDISPLSAWATKS